MFKKSMKVLAEANLCRYSDLPRGWMISTLEQVTSPRGLKVKPTNMPGTSFIGMVHIEAHTMKLLGMGQTDDIKSAGSYFAQGDVLYGRLRPYLNKVYMPEFEGLASGEFIVFREHPFLDNAYLKYFLNQIEFATYATRLNAGDRPRVEFGQLADYPFPLPPLPEQHRIVAEIEKQFTRLDASVGALKRAQANLKRYRASVLKAACEGKLVPTEAELARSEGRDYDPAELLLERIIIERRAKWESQKKRRGKYKEPVAPDTSDLPDLPEGWVWASLSSIGEVRLGRQRSPKRAVGPNMRPYLRAANITWDGLNLTDVKEMDFNPAEYDTYRLRRGDILLAEASGSADEVGKPAVWDGQIDGCCFQNTLIRVRAFPEIIPYLFHHLLSDARSGALGRAARGVGIHHLGAQRTGVWMVALPPLAEQQRVVADVERRLSVIQQAEAAVEVGLKRVERLRQSILKQAFSGKLVPQDPNDEPASVLLERIRAEREAAEAAAKSKRKPRRRRTGMKPRTTPPANIALPRM